MSIKLLPASLLVPAILFCSATGRAEEAPVLTKVEVERTIRAYLLEHPEILVDMREQLQMRQRAAQSAKFQGALMANREVLVAAPGSPVTGAPKDAVGGVTI